VAALRGEKNEYPGHRPVLRKGADGGGRCADAIYRRKGFSREAHGTRKKSLWLVQKKIRREPNGGDHKQTEVVNTLHGPEEVKVGENVYSEPTKRVSNNAAERFIQKYGK